MIEIGLQLAHLGQERVVVGVRIGELLADLVEAVDLALDLADGLLHVLENGLALRQRWLLKEDADRGFRVLDRIAVVGLLEPGHDLEQR